MKLPCQTEMNQMQSITPVGGRRSKSDFEMVDGLLRLSLSVTYNAKEMMRFADRPWVHGQ